MRRFLEAGKIVGVHGIRGELRVYPYCDSVKDLVALPRLFFDDEGTAEVGVESIRGTAKLALLKIRGYDTVEDARKLLDKLLYFDRADLKLPKGVFFITDLLGSSVVDADSKRVYGELVDVTSNGAHDVYHVQMAAGGRRFIPAVGEFIAGIDMKAGTIEVRPIPGMLED